MSSYLIILLGLICGGLPIMIVGGIGIYLIIDWQRVKSKIEKSLTWALTKGEVIDRNIHIVGSLHGGEEYAPVVSYSYVVGDQTFQSQVFSFGKGPRFVVYEEAIGMLDKYQLGDEVSVYFNPEDPAEAVLERDSPVSKRGMIVGVLLLVPVVCMLCGLMVLLLDQIISSI